MTPSSDYIVRGDHLPVLTELAVGQASGLDSPRALVWGLDLTSAASRRAAHKLLRQECRGVAHASEGHGRLSHLFVVYTHGASLPQGSCLAAASQAATKLHAELERARARFVEVVLIDATGWEDGDALRERITQTVATPAGVAGNVALGWNEIVDSTIHKAATTQIC